MDQPTHIFNVRGRPVGFVPGRFGGALVAVERGYFPVSSTGYRSLAGHFGITGGAGPADISPDFLEALAATQDRTRQTSLVRLRRAPVPTADRLSNFISVCFDAEAALAEGFFASDADRFALWRAAFRLLHLIDTNPRFQPTPTAPAWSAAGCAEALAARRALLGFVRQLARGDLPSLPEGTHLAVSAYLELPPKAGGEPAFELPAVMAELPLNLPPPGEFDDEEEHDDVEAEPLGMCDNDPAQMSLL